MNWLRIRELVRKEFIQLFSDKRNRALMVVFPFIMMLVFVTSSITTSGTSGCGVDYSKTHESRSLIKSFEGGNIFHVTQNVIHDRQMTELLLRQKIDMESRSAMILHR
jgi:ABC-2 type transport system permease protein